SFRCLARLMAEMEGMGPAVEVEDLGMDDEQLRAALADSLFDAQVDDRYIVRGVRCDDNDRLAVVEVLDAQRLAAWGWNLRSALQRYTRSLPGSGQEPGQEIELLVRDVLAQRDREPSALQAVQQRHHRLVPCGVAASQLRRTQTPGRINLPVVEATAVADPAFVYVAVLVRRHAHELIAALPQGDAAADSALGTDRGGVVHVPRTGLEAPEPAGQGADRAEGDDVAAEDRLERPVRLTRRIGG